MHGHIPEPKRKKVRAPVLEVDIRVGTGPSKSRQHPSTAPDGDAAVGTRGSTQSPPERVGQVAFVPGQLIRWWSNGWRHGRLIEAGRKWAKVSYLGRTKRILLSDLKEEPS